MMISVKTFMHQKQALAKISGPEIMFAKTHTRVQEMWGGGGEGGGKRGAGWGDEGGLGIGGGVTSPPSLNSPYGGQMSQNLHWNTQFLRFYKIIILLPVSIANELDRERLRNFRGETETEIVRNSKVLVDFEVRI
jgi:hypothetical protein